MQIAEVIGELGAGLGLFRAEHLALAARAAEHHQQTETFKVRLTSSRGLVTWAGHVGWSRGLVTVGRQRACC